MAPRRASDKRGLMDRITVSLGGRVAENMIFGEVTTGMASVEALAAAGSSTGKTSEKLTIERSWIVVVPAKTAPRQVQRDAKK